MVSIASDDCPTHSPSLSLSDCSPPAVTSPGSTGDVSVVVNADVGVVVDADVGVGVGPRAVSFAD